MEGRGRGDAGWTVADCSCGAFYWRLSRTFSSPPLTDPPKGLHAPRNGLVLLQTPFAQRVFIPPSHYSLCSVFLHLDLQLGESIFIRFYTAHPDADSTSAPDALLGIKPRPAFLSSSPLGYYFNMSSPLSPGLSFSLSVIGSAGVWGVRVPGQLQVSSADEMRLEAEMNDRKSLVGLPQSGALTENEHCKSEQLINKVCGGEPGRLVYIPALFMILPLV